MLEKKNAHEIDTGDVEKAATAVVIVFFVLGVACNRIVSKKVWKQGVGAAVAVRVVDDVLIMLRGESLWWPQKKEGILSLETAAEIAISVPPPIRCTSWKKKRSRNYLPTSLRGGRGKPQKKIRINADNCGNIPGGTHSAQSCVKRE